jgi:hypothetical protein
LAYSIIHRNIFLILHPYWHYSALWDHQFLRILSGKQKGERYVIKSNTDNGITVIGYSLPSGKQLRVNSGDKFSVGAGYSTPMYYTRQNGDEGIWDLGTVTLAGNFNVHLKPAPIIVSGILKGSASFLNHKVKFKVNGKYEFD